MSDYNQFVMAVNKIFEITAKIKAGWKDQDNINITESIEESKTTVIEAAKLFNTKTLKPTEVNPSKDNVDLTLNDDDADETGVIDE